MPRRRRDLTPDNRLDWRDPDMPCLGYYPGGMATAPEIVQRLSTESIALNHHVTWHDDPLYFAAERKRSRRRTP